MKKTLIALMALAGVAFGTVETGSYTLSMDNWTTGNDTLYNYLYGAINEGGTLTFNLTIDYTGDNCGAYQTLLHVGKSGTGFSIMANGGPKLIVGELHETSDYDQFNHELGTPSLSNGSNEVIVTITGNATPGTAAVAITLGGVEYSKAAGNDFVADLDWNTMAWDTTNNEHAKYSVNYKAPGYGSGSGMHAQSTTLTAATATYTAAVAAPPAPEPATATLSLLALAGLAVRRRRK